MKHILARSTAIAWPFVILTVIAILAMSELPGRAHGTQRVAARTTSVRPNILFVLTDDLSSDLLRFMPNVRQMQSDGVTLSRYFVVDSLCCPSRSSILTGRYPHNTGVFTNHLDDGGYRAFTANRNTRRTFGNALHRAGYLTGFMGKYLNGYQPRDGVPAGWSEWDVAGFGYRQYDYDLNENGRIRHYGSRSADYMPSVLSRKASAFITAAADRHRPFALEIAPFSPHLPAIAATRDAASYPRLRAPRPPSWNQLPTRAPGWLAGFPALSQANTRGMGEIYRKRVRAVLSIDRMVGHLRAVLNRLDLARNTYVVFSSDNGYHLGQHRLRPGKQTAFDTDIRVPLVVTGPRVPAGRRIAAVIASIDLAPTLARVGGTHLPARADGTSMLSIWHGRVPVSWRDAVLVEHHGGRLSPDDPDYQPYRSGDPPSYEAIRTSSALYVEYVNGDREYYNLRTDPYQLHNRITRAPAKALRPLRRALHALESCAGPTSCAAAAQLSS